MSPCWFWPGLKPRVTCSMRSCSSSIGIDRAGDDEVVAQRDAVPVLLGGPAVDPEAPRAVHAEVHRDLAVIGRQVVLGQQVLQHRDLGDLGQLRLLGVPVLAAEGVVVLAVGPRDVVVRVPVLAHRQVPVDVLLDHWLELVQQLQVGQVLSTWPLPVICTCWLHSIYLCTPVTFKSCRAECHSTVTSRHHAVAVRSRRAMPFSPDFLPQATTDWEVGHDVKKLIIHRRGAAAAAASRRPGRCGHRGRRARCRRCTRTATPTPTIEQIRQHGRRRDQDRQRGRRPGDCIVTNAWDAAFVRDGESASRRGAGRAELQRRRGRRRVSRVTRWRAPTAGKPRRPQRARPQPAEQQELEAVSTRPTHSRLRINRCRCRGIGSSSLVDALKLSRSNYPDIAA